jgi:hypothetical protein
MKTMSIISPDFEAVRGLITLRRSRALQAVNNENLLTAWEVGAFVSARLKTAKWGGKTVTQLAEYLRAQDPTLRGYSRANIYNMVALFDTYSSAEFLQYAERMNLGSFVQALPAQMSQTVSGQFPNFLNLTTLTNHFEILSACRSNENPSIGILLCQGAYHAVVEYALNRSLSPTMVAEYKRLLIPKEVLQHSLETFGRFLGFKGQEETNDTFSKRWKQ